MNVQARGNDKNLFFAGGVPRLGASRMRRMDFTNRLKTLIGLR